MRAENKKILVIIALALSALLINIPSLAILLGKDVTGHSFDWLYKIGFFRWDWLLVFCLAGSALAGTLCWRPGRPLLRWVVIFFSVIAMGLAVISLLLLIIAYVMPA